jgi:hypothetical protein
VIGGLGVGPGCDTGLAPVADGAERELVLDEVELPLPAGRPEGEPLAGKLGEEPLAGGPGVGLWAAAAVLGLRAVETGLGALPGAAAVGPLAAPKR